MKRLFILIPIACIAFFACNKTPKEESIAKIEVKASAATEITLTEATISGSYVIEPSSIKAEEVGFFYGTDATLKECEKVISEDQGGKFNSEIGDLTSETKYYFQAYITVRNEIKFSSILSFTTKGEAVITTDEVTNITTTSATCGGNITSDGGLAITERGICYSTSQNPTTADSKVAATSAGTGAYSCDISGLTKNTTYYVRAYAVNSVGTYYGAQQSFKTKVDPVVDPIDYIENGINLGKSILVKGKWDGTNETYLHWAPVNCGYEEKGTVNSNSDHRLGLLYQWGYGDPTLMYYSKAVAIYYDTATPSPWYDYNTITGTTSDKWNNNQGPCPAGWRLPSSAEFNVLCAGKNGLYGWVSSGTYSGNTGYKGAEFFGANTPTTEGTGVFFPAAGTRYPSSGTAASRGALGFYWSSSLDPSNSEIKGCYLYSTSTILSVYSYNYRAAANSVRCVADPE